MSVDQYKKEVGMMNLEKLIETREGISNKQFPIPEKELLARFEQLYLGAVNDVMREFCLLQQALPNRVKPLREYRTVAGFAFTVKSAPNVKITGEMEYRTQMLDELGEDHFVVWDTSRVRLIRSAISCIIRLVTLCASMMSASARIATNSFEAPFWMLLNPLFQLNPDSNYKCTRYPS